MKRIVSMLCIMAMVFVMDGCSFEEENRDEGIVLKDHLNREVKLDKAAETVISSYYISTTTLIALGAEEQLVGVEMKAAERDIYKLAAPQLLELPAMGNKKNFNIEECAKLNPDLVVLPMSLKDYVSQLEELDIPVVVVNPETMDLFLDSVKLLGKATGHEETANELLDYYDEIQDDIKEDLSEVKEEKSVYFSSGSDVLMSSTSSMFQSELIKMARGINVASGLSDTNWTAISAEELLNYNPSYIFMENRSQSLVDALLSDARFTSLDAVVNKQVYTFPSNIDTWDTPSPSSILGMYWMSSILYPEEIEMEDVREEAISFYDEFFDIKVSGEDLGI